MATLGVRFLDDRNHKIGFAFLISVALHVALLSILPVLRSAHHHRGNTAAPILVRLAEPLRQPVPNQVFLTAPEEPEPRSVAPKRQPPSRPAPAEPAAQVVPKNSPATATIEPAQATDAGTLAQYRLSVLGAARRFKHYPDAAVENNWQGTVEIRMVIDSSGEISALDVRTSAGHTVLDQHALQIIERAKAISPIPPGLRGREFAVEVPIVFRLREAGA